MKSSTGVRFMARLALLATLLVGASARAAGIWFGVGSGSWTAGSSWDGGTVPGSGDQALMAWGRTAQVGAAAPDVGEIYFVDAGGGVTVEVNPGGSLKVLRNIYVQNPNLADSLKVQGGALTVDGTVSLRNIFLTDGSLDMTDGALTAYGPFTFSGGTLKNPATVAIGGTSPGNLTQSGGTLERSAGGTTSVGAYALNNSAAALVSGGTLSVAGGISNGGTTGQSVMRVEGGTLNLNGQGALVGQLAFRGGTISNVGAAGVTLNGTGDALVLRNTAVSFNVSLTGSSGNIVFEKDNNGTGVLSGSLAFGGVTRTVNVADGAATEDLRFSGQVANGGLNKSGAGTLTLSGINTYSGPTLVSAGTLSGGTGGACPNSPVIVADGAANGILALTEGGQWACASLTYTGGAAGLVFDLATLPVSAVNAPLQINGDLNVTGAVAVVVRHGSWPSVGTYPLVSYSGSLNGPGIFTLAGLPADVDATLVINTGAKRLELSVTAFQHVNVWTNLVSGNAGGAWETSANWLDGVPDAIDAIADFSTLDIAAASTVTVEAPHTVGKLLFGDTEASHDWTVTGSALALATSVGLPAITVNNQTATIQTALTGTQGLIKNGAGTLTLTGVKTYSGPTLVSAGALSGATGGSCLDSPVIVAGGAANGVVAVTEGGQWACASLTYTEGAAGLAFDLTALPVSAANAPLQINGDLNVTGTVAVVVRNGSWPSAGTYPLVSYSGNLNGPGTFTLAGLPAGVAATLVNNTGAKRLELSVTAVQSVWTNLVSGNAGGTWGTSANWSSGVPDAADAVADFSTLDITAASTVTVEAPHTVGTLLFGDTAASHDWTVTGSTLALATSAGLPAITVSNQTAVIQTVLTGTQGLIKNGAGTLSLDAVNTFTGGTTVDQGTLTLNASDVAVRGTVTVNAGGTLGVAGPSWVGFGQNADKITTLNLVGGTVNNTQSDAMLKDATVNMTAGTWAGSTCYWINSKLNTMASDKPSTLSGGILFYPAFGAPILDMTVADGSAATDLLISGVIADGVGPGSVIKSGAGLLELTAVNTYTGGTTVDQGILRLNAGDAAVRGTVTVNAGGTLSVAGADWAGFGQNAGRISTLNIVGGTVHNTLGGTAFITDAAVNMTGGTLSGGQLHWRNTVLNTLASTSTATLSANVTIRNDYAPGVSMTLNVANGAAATDLLISGEISQAIPDIGIIKTGAGTLALTAVNYYAGGTAVDGGTLQVDGVLVADGGEVRVAGGATLAGSGTVARNITVAGNAVLTAGNPAVTNRVGTLTATASTTLEAGAVFAVRLGPAGCDLLAASGGLTLASGAELAVSLDPALGRLPLGYTATVATGAVTGQFKQQTVRLPNQQLLKVSYAGNSITLTSVFNGTLVILI